MQFHSSGYTPSCDAEVVCRQSRVEVLTALLVLGGVLVGLPAVLWYAGFSRAESGYRDLPPRDDREEEEPRLEDAPPDRIELERPLLR